MEVKKAFVADREKTPQHFQVIQIQAENCRRLDNGNWQIEILARPLTQQELSFLAHMFPNTQEQVWSLLRKESLLAAIIEEVGQ